MICYRFRNSSPKCVKAHSELDPQKRQEWEGVMLATWIKPGAVVIDVGINAIDDPSKAVRFNILCF